MDDGGPSADRDTLADEQDLLTLNEAGARIRAELESERAQIRTLEAASGGVDVESALASILGTSCCGNRLEVQRGGKPKRRLLPPHQGMGTSSSGMPASMSTGV